MSLIRSLTLSCLAHGILLGLWLIVVFTKSFTGKGAFLEAGDVALMLLCLIAITGSKFPLPIF